MPKISVIVPIFGVENYIERCAVSLFEQTLDDIEYIFIDDCTPDNSISILKEVLKKYPQKNSLTRIVKMPTNSGLPAVRRHGINCATGDYIIHCDSDDWANVTMYEKMYNKAIEGNYDIVSCDYYRSNGSTNIYFHQVDRRLMVGPLWNRLVKKEICKDNYILHPTCNKAEDSALMAQYSFYAKSVAYVNEPLYYYFDNPTSICGVKTESALVSKLEQEIKNTNLRIDFLKHHNAEKEYEQDVAIWKYTCRFNIRALLGKDEYYKKWRETYPELDANFYICRFLPMKSVIKYLMLRWRFSKNKII